MKKKFGTLLKSEKTSSGTIVFKTSLRKHVMDLVTNKSGALMIYLISVVKHSIVLVVCFNMQEKVIKT